jgi:hypothetical protein
MIALKPVRIGLILALSAILYGYLFGIAFGAWEDAMKDDLKASGQAVLESVYGGDEAAMTKVLEKSWSYYKRSHLHAGALGASAVAQILLLSLLAVAPRLKAVTAFLLGAGALGYGVYWWLAGMRAPGLGSTDLAKESLDWFAMPTAGASLIGTVLVLAFTVRTVFAKAQAPV